LKQDATSVALPNWPILKNKKRAGNAFPLR
jgi:hypothetical protein